MNISTMPITDLKVEEPFSTLFPVGEDTLEGIRLDMESNGYDDAFPIIVWEEKGIVVDGHTRFTAALAVGLETVPVLIRNFENEDDAILYAFHLQRNRRNLADEDILRCLQLLDTIDEARGESDGEKRTKREKIKERASELGTSESKIDKAKKVMEHADDSIREAVESGEKSINQAFNEMQEIRRESGELKGRNTSSLACGARYSKTLGKLIEELTRIRDEGWEQISIEKALLDVETLKNIIEG
ncbi:ParB/RepB/Spo0J family partition protein [Desulfoluna spongiiphila]|uniref:Chromosome partitioning protein, ParB family n=1 Tax=Desulfoluna spongiiphila TaxID=419481 RepID=A0A1G5I024_9BACT|nr:ParB/RepB/Spo0J family partition protein [Desulfoluna spongiiphila]SCY68930.1 chromosome partitioning protein, ParB family [Desulfoluna spongiiphila]VVS94944.1 parb/sulfiredoxin [Desulfoluna spongiiphila]